MKIFTKVALVSLIILSLIPSTLAQDTEAIYIQPPSFPDVSVSHPYYDAINYVQSEGIVKGYEDGTYKPEKVINRAEFTKIIMAATIPAEHFANCTRQDEFSDVLDTDWFAPYICMAHTNGIIEGYSSTSFKPNDPVKFAEAAKIIVKGFSYTTQDFTDEDWYKPFLIELETRNAIPTTIRDLENQVTRGEMAYLIYVLQEHIDNHESNHFYTFQDGSYNKIQGEVQTFIMNTKIDLESPIEVTLNNLDEEDQNTMYDFDTATLGGNGVTPDVYLFQHFFGNQWMHSTDWNVVKMTSPFNEITECPQSGYSSVLNDNGDGTGTPADPYTGDVFCLQTSDEKFVLLEVLDAGNDGENIYLTLKYYLQPNGSRFFN